MKRFSFRLEPVLAYRKLREDGEEQKLKVIQSAILENERQRQELNIKIENGTRLLQERSKGTIDIEKILSLTGYIQRLRSEVIRVNQLRSKLEQDRLAQLSRLLEARRGREVVEKIKENNYSAYQKETQALEQKLLDELSVTQYGRLAEQELPG